MDLRSLLAYLATALPEGLRGTKVTDFASIKGQIADPSTSKIYELEISVEEYENGKIWVLDLNKFW